MASSYSVRRELTSASICPGLANLSGAARAIRHPIVDPYHGPGPQRPAAPNGEGRTEGAQESFCASARERPRDQGQGSGDEKVQGDTRCEDGSGLFLVPFPIGDHGITAPTLWALLGDAPGRWESFRHLQAHAGAVPVTKRSGKQQRVVHFRFACDKSLRYVVDQVAFLSLRSCEWARAYYDQQRARGHSHRQALRALGAKWLKIIFVMWQRQVSYDEQYHLATMTRPQLRQQRQKTIA